MAYNNNIPLPRDRYRVSQGDILQNFQSIDTVTQVNHVLFNDADQGKHKFVQFPNISFRQVSEPDTGGTQVALYAEEGGTFPPSQPQSTTGLVFKRSSGTTVNFTDTFVQSRDFGSLFPNQLSTYWNRLPSGLLIKYGTVFINVNSDNVSSPPPIIEITTGVGPDFNNIYWTNITPQRDPNIDPNAANADPNVVIYSIGPNLPNIEARFRAWTRNLFNTARRTPKTDVFLRITLIGD